MKKEARPYQLAACSRIVEQIETGAERALVVLATGLGKSVISAKFTRHWFERYRAKGPVLFLMHMVDPLQQILGDEYGPELEGLDLKIELLKDAKQLKGKTDVSFATFQTMRNLIRVVKPNHFGLVIVDEAHHGQAETYGDVIRYLKPAFLLGQTATPRRMDGRDVTAQFGEPVYSYDLVEALADGLWLAGIDYDMVLDGIDHEKLDELVARAQRGDRTITRAEIDSVVFGREQFQDVARRVREAQGPDGMRTIFFCDSIADVERVAELFPDARAYHTSLHSTQQAATLYAYRHGAFQEILVVNKFNEAIDIPDAELIVFLRSTDSETIFYQQLGRGLRLAPGKTRVKVLDFVGNTKRLVMIQRLMDRLRDAMIARGKTEHKNWSISLSSDLQKVLEVVQRVDSNFYPTIEEASAACEKLWIINSSQYYARAHLDDRLPPLPADTYGDVWETRGGWDGFLKTDNQKNIELLAARLYRVFDGAPLSLEMLADSTRSPIGNFSEWQIKQFFDRLCDRGYATRKMVMGENGKKESRLFWRETMVKNGWRQPEEAPALEATPVVEVEEAPALEDDITEEEIAAVLYPLQAARSWFAALMEECSSPP
ncbi:MAG: DEAD/DEAH box helicase family protein [Candidatus Magasanikbacteria bacterium]|nr:DEAD/DEAH box helicase family protein [Candidatus Magasanikbacteria bacterium]